MLMTVALAVALPAAGAPVGDALLRPALAVKSPQRAVLLSAAQAGGRIVAVGERGVVALSDDQGATWRQAACPVSVTLTMVRFADATRGVAVGHGGTVLTTADAGMSWVVRLDGRRLAQIAKAAARTPEALREAERLVGDGPDKPFLDVVVWDAERMLAVGAYGIAFHTLDGGRTWTPWMERLPNPRGLHWYVARRAGHMLVLAGEQGLIARSDDSGSSFASAASPYKGSWFAGELGHDGGLLLAGLRGNVWRSADSGASWVQVTSPLPASITATAMGSDGIVLLASQAGAVLRLRGHDLTRLDADPLPLPLPAGLLALRDGPVISVGLGGAVPLVMRGQR